MKSPAGEKETSSESRVQDDGAEKREAQSKTPDVSGETTPVAVESKAVSGSPPGKASGGVDSIIKMIISSGRLTPEESKAIQGLSKDHTALKTKIDRLKGLLGRSAKAQREAAVELKCSQKKLDQALRDVKRLNDKVDHLSSRPTHSKCGPCLCACLGA